MSEEQTKAKRHLLKKLTPGTKLLITEGIKRGRQATFVGEVHDNPWLINVLIDRVPRVVRWQWVEVQ